MRSTIVSRRRPVSPASLAGFASALLTTAAFASACSSTPESSTAASADEQALAALPKHTVAKLCVDPTGKSRISCNAVVRTDVPAGYVPDFSAVQPDKTSPYAGAWSPADLKSAYSIPGGGAGVTVAVVNYGGDPTVESDLAVYRKAYGLPPCTVANGCLTRVDGHGDPNPQAHSPGGTYQQALALSLAAVSAACPACKLLSVEVNSEEEGANEGSQLFTTAIDTAANLGAKAIVVSDSTYELKDNDAWAPHFDKPGVSIFAAVGDQGWGAAGNDYLGPYGATFPADVPGVFAVGGTTLARSSGSARGWAESVWNDQTPNPVNGAFGATNGGCSEFFGKPAWQTSTACTSRETNDIAVVADATPGFNFYNSYKDPAPGDTLAPYQWQIGGGTALAAALAAGIFAASGKAGVSTSYVYGHASAFHDITLGENFYPGDDCSGSLCNAVKGYDSPSGIGSPNGALLAAAK